MSCLRLYDVASQHASSRPAIWTDPGLDAEHDRAVVRVVPELDPVRQPGRAERHHDRPVADRRVERDGGQAGPARDQGGHGGGVGAVVRRPAAHLNGASGLGDWPEGRALLDSLRA
ncbi:hypothetical protein [Nocardioides plantarum]|uniref:Uncharacterized protein n=1 Tax=Nocardioides plantarum TaxID=29299 RepID=A0ABV5K973_9ACTN|nr:hypothetical protein [Nocardioides plantarum]